MVDKVICMNVENTKLPPRGYVDKKAESKIRFEVDPSRDYMADVDALLPSWRPENYKPSDLHAGCAFSENTGPNILVDYERGAEYALPHTKYVRAMSPSGHILPLSVSTCRPTPERPDGDDGLGTYDRVIGEKQRRGWRILEGDSTFEGRTGEEYLAWCLAVRDHRMAINAAYEAADAASHESKLLAATKAQAKENQNMVQNITEGLSKAIIDGMATVATANAANAVSKGRASKGE
jgi:hypothetical protein